MKLALVVCVSVPLTDVYIIEEFVRAAEDSTWLFVEEPTKGSNPDLLESGTT